jgi:hypothetical protein
MTDIEHDDDVPVVRTRRGRYDKALGKLREKYQNALNDHQLTDLREPLAAMDAIIQRLMERMEDLDTFDYRRRAKTLLWDFYANFRDHPELAWQKLTELKKLHSEGGAEDRIVMTLVKALQTHSRRIEGWWEINLARRNAVNAKDLFGILSRMVDIVDGEASPEVAQRIRQRFTREIMGGETRSLVYGQRESAREIVVEEPKAKEPEQIAS